MGHLGSVRAGVIGAIAAGALVGTQPLAADPQPGLSPRAELAAVGVATRAAPSFFPGYDPHCQSVTALIANVKGTVMAGNFRDQQGGCYVWLNLRYADYLTSPEICKLGLHELGHLTGLAHSADPSNVMYAPFDARPLPPPCVPPKPR